MRWHVAVNGDIFELRVVYHARRSWPGQVETHCEYRYWNYALCILWQLGKLSRRLNFFFSTAHQSHCGSHVCLDHLLLVCAAVAEGKGRWLRLPFRTVKPHSTVLARQGGTRTVPLTVKSRSAAITPPRPTRRTSRESLREPFVCPELSSQNVQVQVVASSRREPLVCIWRSPVTQEHLRLSRLSYPR